MGTPLGVLSANFYLGIMDSRCYKRPPPRYINDTLVVADDGENLQNLIISLTLPMRQLDGMEGPGHTC